jgi:hypothetical protein
MKFILTLVLAYAYSVVAVPYVAPQAGKHMATTDHGLLRVAS